jgi:hypothetical protein
MKRIATLTASLALLLPAGAVVLPSTALAAGGDSSCQTYSSQTCQVASNTTARTIATTSASTLPFTGLDVVLLAAGGGALLGAGLVMRRLSRANE